MNVAHDRFFEECAIYHFHMACMRGELKLIRKLVEEGRVNPSVNNDEGIRLASRYGQLDVVKYLTTIPYINPTTCDYEAIRSASHNNHYRTVLELMSHIPNIPKKVITREIESLVFERACDLSRLHLPAELCWLIGECIWGPGSGICFGEQKRRKALKKIRWLRDYVSSIYKLIL